MLGAHLKLGKEPKNKIKEASHGRHVLQKELRVTISQIFESDLNLIKHET